MQNAIIILYCVNREQFTEIYINIMNDILNKIL